MTERVIEGFTVFTVTPRTGRVTNGVLYLHGGAYVAGMAPQHWSLVSRMVDAGLRVDVPDYGLAPRWTHHDAYPFLIRAFRELRGQLGAGRVRVVGDSAGGGLALGLAQALRTYDEDGPDSLLLIAPWLDLTLENPSIAKIDDPWLSRTVLSECARAWAGGTDPDDPRLSPINGPLTGLPPVHLYVGTRDILHPDAALWSEQARAAGVAVTLTVCEGAVHVYPLVPAPEGRAAAAAIVAELAGDGRWAQG
ncbi:alpha/beta hydrolase fold domain-containing protein [Microbacterium sp. EST19A]|uniref:alpha/beta hydrolase fold domain-containing protein n=1 Tax=Microbacterium sp. EST19A TaxID=2862681 RepID=UPI001CBFA905|nr:alpha/beta hydrolase [Microbacterium sp. EST19A]